MPKKYDFVQGKLSRDEDGVLNRLSAVAEQKVALRLLLLQKLTGDEYVAVFEYEEPQEMPDSLTA